MGIRARWRVLAGTTMCGLSLAAGVGQAHAAECMSSTDCFDASQLQVAAANDYSNKAAWFRETSKQNFINAKQWGDKATFAFYAGNATAAAWYKAVADDYGRKAVADAKAADDYAAKAQFTRAAAENSFKRGTFFSPLESEEGSDGEYTTAGVKFSKKCVPKKAQAPALRAFHICWPRKIERVPSMYAINAAALNALAYCTAIHARPTKSLPGYVFSLAKATAWCGKWKWGWVVVVT